MNICILSVKIIKNMMMTTIAIIIKHALTAL